MKTIIHMTLSIVLSFFGLLSLLGIFLPDVDFFVFAGTNLACALVAGANIGGSISENTLVRVRRWRGNIDDRYVAIDSLVNLIRRNQPAWPIPAELLDELIDRHDRLDELINLCRSASASTIDREQRNVLLKSTMNFCRLRIRIWAYKEFDAGTLSIADIHSLGFLLPGENGGFHSRISPTHATAEVKVRVTFMDNVCVVVDQAAQSNSARTKNAWPRGVRYAVIVITSADGNSELCRQMTSRTHTYIELPQSTRGKQVIINAAFLQHVDDQPRFGETQSVVISMPLTVQDLLSSLETQHQNDREERARESERYHQEVERLQAERKAAEAKK
jgi:hypothetical protein